MSPILLRPIREQFEHDRVIRQLQARWRRRFGVAVNPGAERENPVKGGGQVLYPDLVLTSSDRGRRLCGVVEVETAESVNHLEAMAEWAPLAKVRGAFYLYVPAGSADVARRLCEENRVNVTEIWTYYAIGSQVRFSMIHRSTKAAKAATRGKTKKVRAATKKKAKPSKPAKKVSKSARKKSAGKKAAAAKSKGKGKAKRASKSRRAASKRKK